MRRGALGDRSRRDRQQAQAPPDETASRRVDRRAVADRTERATKAVPNERTNLPANQRSNQRSNRHANQTANLDASLDANRVHLRRWRVVAVGGLLWITAHASGLLGPLAYATFVLLALVALVATIVGVRVHRPAVRWPWIVGVTAQLLFLAGGAARIGLGTLGDLTAERSLVPDAIILPGYLLMACGLAGFVLARNRGRGRDLDALLDGVVASLAALMVAWTYLINPALSQEHAPLTVRLVLAAYPPMSVFLVAVAARIAFVAGTRPQAAQRLLLATLLCTLAGDVYYMLIDARLLDVPLRYVDVPYALAYLLGALAVLHPSMRVLSEPIRTAETAPGAGRLAVVVASLALPAIVAVAQLSYWRSDRGVLIAIVGVLMAFGLVRIHRALRAHATSEARLVHQATHDALTGLPNRVYLREYLTAALARANAERTALAVLFLDMDRFKLVNDSRGHSTGDELLVAVASRLRTNTRIGDTVARIGGDEFVVVLDPVRDLQESVALAERLHLCFQEPFALRAGEIYSTTSVGLAFVDFGDDVGGHAPSAAADHHGDDDGDDAQTMTTAEDLIRAADTAMYRAKEAGRDGVAVFDRSMRDRVAERLTIEQDLRSALVGNELHVQFQPIVQLASGRCDGFEALVRWTHPTRGLVPPSTFIPIAEDTGLIDDIGLWVIDQACRELAVWRRLPGGGSLRVAVNVSARQLRGRRLLPAVREILDRHDLPGDALCLELTESLLMEDPDAAAAVLHALRALDVHLSIDDFGTGYSSLSYLKRFPVDVVKIDRSFVEGLEHPDSSEESLIAAIIAMAQAMKMTTVAEGVETATQAARLEQLACTRVQGYLYSRPLPPAQVPDALRRIGIVESAPPPPAVAAGTR